MTAAPTRYVALLRGINLGKARQVDMTRLREILTARGHGDVRTHLRSGNVVLTSPLGERKLATDLSAASCCSDRALSRTTFPLRRCVRTSP